jgi:hypothetical protein
MAYVETAERRLKVISWGSVIAGALTVLAVSLLLSLLTTGLGLGMVDATSNDPLGGVGATFGWTSAVALLVSLAAGGYLAGYLSGVAGWVHGFLTWALAMLIAAYLSFAAIGGAVNVGGQLLGGAINVTGAAAGAAGNAIGGAAGLAGNAASGLADMLNADQISDIDGDDVVAQLRQAANQANLEALQPQLVEDQLDGARQEITAAGRNLLSNPGDYEAIVSQLVDQLKARVGTLESEINRDDIVKAISDNTTLDEQQVQQAADRAVELYQGVATSAREQISNFEQTVTATQAQIKQVEAQAREQADRAAAAASSAALWGFGGALLGALVAIGAAIFGARSPVDARNRY